MSKPLISVIIPVYNVEQYLDDCITSLIQQTYKNIEIIIIDDGSNDGSSTKCDYWQEMDCRIRVIHTDNRGVSHARNVGLNAMHGDYVGFLDADDWVDNDTYEELLKAIVDSDADVSGGGYIHEDKNGGYITLKKGKAKIFSREDILKEIFSSSTPKLLYWELCDKLFKREIITNIRFDESIGTAEDKLFFWQIMKNVNRFAYVPLFKYHYRMRDGSAVHSGVTEKTISAINAERYIWQMSREEKGTLRNLMLTNYVNSILGCTRQMLVYDEKRYENEIKKNQSEIRKYFFQYIVMSNVMFRSFMAMIFLSLPLRICVMFVELIRKDND